MTAASAIDGSTTELGGVARLDVTLVAAVDFNRISAVFDGPDALWLGERAPDGPGGRRRYSCDLELRVSPDARSLFRKAAIVGLGEPRRDGDIWIVPIEWFAATLAPLFPVFVGELRLQADRIALYGTYVPPGGVIGYALDRGLLRIAARGTAKWFLRKVASVLD
jgi:hypothetical protein